MSIPLDYETLRIIWWLLLGVLLIGFAIMDGYDLGVAMLLPFVARDDTERRVTINAIGPFWEGNQVWLILGAGAVFAAWPPVYAASFSGFYIAMFLVLATLILRPVGFEFRNKIRRHALARILGLCVVCRRPGAERGVRRGIRQSVARRSVPHRSAICAFSTKAADCSSCSIRSACCAVWSRRRCWRPTARSISTLRTDGAVQGARSHGFVAIGASATSCCLPSAGLWVWLGIDGYAITSAVVPDGPSNPLLKTVVRPPGRWFANYGAHPWMIAAPLLGLLGPAAGADVHARAAPRLGVRLPARSAFSASSPLPA